MQVLQYLFLCGLAAWHPLCVCNNSLAFCRKCQGDNRKMSCHHSHTPPRTKEYSVFSGPLERLKGKKSVFHHMAIHPTKP